MRTLVAYIIVLAVTSAGLVVWQDDQNDQLHRNQVAACIRGNDLRNTANELVRNQTAIKESLEDFLDDAVSARRESGDEEVARKYERTLNRLSETGVRELHIATCSAIVER